jgi:glycosyltransferase involved in cell wall biosynthesis
MSLFKLLCPSTHIVYDIHEELPLEMLTKLYLPQALRRALGEMAAWTWRVCGRIFDGFAPATPAIGTWFPGGGMKVVRNLPKAIYAVEEREALVPDPLRWVFTGALNAERGIWDLLWLVERFRGMGMAVTLELYGPCREDDLGQAIAALEALGWCKHVPWLPAPELAKSIRGAGLGFITYQSRPNFQEGISTKLLEFMACGIPAVGSDFPMMRRIIEGAGAGILVPPEDREGLLKAIDDLIRQPETLQEMSRNGRRTYQRDYRWDDEVASLRWHLRASKSGA